MSNSKESSEKELDNIKESVSETKVSNNVDETTNNESEKKPQNSNNENLDENDNDLQSELSKVKDQLLRALAENENLRRRTQKDIETTKKFGHISFVRDLLTTVDNLDRAVKASPLEKDKLDEPIKNLIVGVEIVLNEINSFLEKNQINKINPINEKFDYNYHQAMYEQPTKEVEPGTVIEVIQAGYLLHDRLVRPALVGISKAQIKEEIETDENTTVEKSKENNLKNS